MVPGAYFNFLRYCLDELEAAPASEADEAERLTRRYARILRADLTDLEKRVLLIGQFDWDSLRDGSFPALIRKYEILHGIADWAREHCPAQWQVYTTGRRGA
ncbi:hypothetical protein P73_4193 [Celeribacter indicus]|uniref:Uncharacterized protein n=1 Tax=Celeribacter indicus TaxID=1208324 RepID=A0A0B5DZM4_9RHOB|nr:hypothetical protein P73_4193 [Celeribacter indicus]